MFSTISFPSLGISMNPPSTVSVGPLTIHWYGAIIAFGLVLAVLYCSRRSREFGLTEDDMLDGVLTVTPLAILCARIYYVAFSWENYKDNPISALYIWQGGIAIYGSVIGAALGILIFSKWKKVKAAAVLDLVSLGFLIGQCIGRWGNFMNREAFGAETESFFRMGLEYAWSGNVIYVHPTFLYESAWNFVGFLILSQLSKHRKYDGQTALQYLVWYGAGRAVIEGLRTDSLYIPGTALRVSQLLAAACCVVGLILLAVFAGKPHDPEKMSGYLLKQKEAAEEQPVSSAEKETFAQKFNKWLRS